MWHFILPLRPELFVWVWYRHLNFKKRPIWSPAFGLPPSVGALCATFGQGLLELRLKPSEKTRIAKPITHRPSQTMISEWFKSSHVIFSTCLINIKHLLSWKIITRDFFNTASSTWKHLLKCGLLWKSFFYWFHACLILNHGREIGLILPHLLHPLMGRIPRDFLWLTRWNCWHSETSLWQSGCHWRSFKGH